MDRLLERIDRRAFNEWMAAAELDPWDDARAVDVLCNGFAAIISILAGEQVDPSGLLSPLAIDDPDRGEELEAENLEEQIAADAIAEIEQIRSIIGGRR